MITRQKNIISLSFMTLVRDIPETLNLKDLSLDYESHPENKGLIAGIYGPQSKQNALFALGRWSRENSTPTNKTGPNRVLLVDAGYHVDNFELTRNQGCYEHIEKTGWVHFDRLQTDYREELKEMWLDWIKKDFSAKEASSVADEAFLSIALRYPFFVEKFIKSDPKIKIVIHPARLTISPSTVLRAATCRYSKESFVEAEVRYLSQVKVKI
jgi:hypothetical protein